MRWTVAVLCALAAVHAAAAAPAPAPAPKPPVSATPAGAEVAAPTDVTDEAAVDPRSDAAWQLYHEVFAALMQGEQTRARALATTLLRDHPDHPATRRIRGAHLGLAPGAVDEHGEAQRHAIRETASRGARAELALFQSLHGLALGIELCVAFECDSGEAFLGLSLIGSAVGAIAPLALDNLTSGERALLNSGTAWGVTNAGLVLITRSSDDDGQTTSLGLMAGQTVGLVGGAVLFKLHPTAGQVALANSGGIWAGALASLLYGASGTHLQQHEQAVGALIAIDAGIAGGAYLASRWPQVSRAQTLVIDAGGIVGGVAGGTLGVLISGNRRVQLTWGLAAAGIVGGLGASGYFTRDWNDDSASSLHAYVAPPAHGRGAVAGIGFPW